MRNNLKKILQTRGFSKVVLTPDILEKTSIKTMHRFNKIWDNEVDTLNGDELIGLMNWLCVKMEEILELDEDTIKLINYDKN
jgi:hypothetical protein